MFVVEERNAFDLNNKSNVFLLLRICHIRGLAATNEIPSKGAAAASSAAGIVYWDLFSASMLLIAFPKPNHNFQLWWLITHGSGILDFVG